MPKAVDSDLEVVFDGRENQWSVAKFKWHGKPVVGIRWCCHRLHPAAKRRAAARGIGDRARRLKRSMSALWPPGDGRDTELNGRCKTTRPSRSEEPSREPPRLVASIVEHHAAH